MSNKKIDVTILKGGISFGENKEGKSENILTLKLKVEDANDAIEWYLKNKKREGRIEFVSRQNSIDDKISK